MEFGGISSKAATYERGTIMNLYIIMYENGRHECKVEYMTGKDKEDAVMRLSERRHFPPSNVIRITYVGGK